MTAYYSTEDLACRSADVVVVEALGEPYYANGHIPGALNLPPHLAREIAVALLPDKEALVVVYGSSRACPQVEMVVRTLLRLGYRNVAVYREGKQGWAAAGLPLVPEGY